MSRLGGLHQELEVKLEALRIERARMVAEIDGDIHRVEKMLALFDGAPTPAGRIGRAGRGNPALQAAKAEKTAEVQAVRAAIRAYLKESYPQPRSSMDIVKALRPAFPKMMPQGVGRYCALMRDGDNPELINVAGDWLWVPAEGDPGGEEG